MAREYMTDSEFVAKLERLGVVCKRRHQIRAMQESLLREDNELDSEEAVLQRQLLAEMESRDVIQRGNFGWEARTLNFLLRIQAEKLK